LRKKKTGGWVGVAGFVGKNGLIFGEKEADHDKNQADKERQSP
jgi:hypothetical protein